jgi:hypothetical protein
LYNSTSSIMGIKRSKGITNPNSIADNRYHLLILKKVSLRMHR